MKEEKENYEEQENKNFEEYNLEDELEKEQVEDPEPKKDSGRAYEWALAGLATVVLTLGIWMALSYASALYMADHPDAPVPEALSEQDVQPKPAATDTISPELTSERNKETIVADKTEEKKATSSAVQSEKAASVSTDAIEKTHPENNEQQPVAEPAPVAPTHEEPSPAPTPAVSPTEGN